ncbi:unnamed protein product [Phyllotreta striolata]|uniref:Protein windpipe n=1 Tax=Phyllotreta striolata TaxID=444603 RepID=A0A9P0DSH1_PHYSR|nr:unnamed protein product [Phyllotreta striolata]
MLKEVFLLAGVAAVCFGASLDLCPEGSSCHAASERLETTSFEFLNKNTEKYYRSIGSLIITNASIDKIDPKLKYLRNLVYLDLSYNNVQISSIPPLHSLRTLILKANNLKNINISLLPQNIEHLDLSDNLLSQIPREWRLLKNLKTIDLYKNPIHCDCNNVLTYDQFIKSEITVPKPLTCSSPLKYAGKEISAVNCSTDDIMLYDEVKEGSGDVDIFEETSSNEPSAKLSILNDEDEDIFMDKNTIIDDGMAEEEGSGDEGSGFEIPMPESGVLGCMVNCSTPSPLVVDPAASPLPSLKEQVNILWNDLNIFKEKEPPTEASTTSTSAAIPSSSSTTHSDAELIETNSENTSAKIGELEKASIKNSNQSAVYAVIGVGIFIAVLFMIAYFKKRSKRAPNNRRENSGPGEEMKPLSKPAIKAANDKPLTNSYATHLPEQTPLINGQNGKSKDDAPKLTSFMPLAHPEVPDRVEDEAPLQNGSPTEDVEMRPKLQPELLTPQRERVTIKEGEIPDSIPRTPLLIHRQKNSEGEIVTTLVP